MELKDWNAWKSADISEMKGKKITTLSLYGEEGPLFICSDGTQYLLTHLQECCERVELEDVNAPLSFWDALNENKHVTIITAEERINQSENEEYSFYSETWTFYSFETEEGYLNLRFHGTSNSFYSESVDIMKRIAQ